MRNSLFTKCFPLALRAIERKENNVALSNLLVEWWVKMNEKNEVAFLNNEQKPFFRFFRDIISSLTESSIQMVYSLPDQKLRSVLMSYLARYLKLRKNFKEETMNKFMLVESIKKLP